MSRILLIVAVAFAMLSTATASSAQCLGDFNGDFKVTVDEIVVAVRNSLDNCELDGPRFLDNRDGTVTDRKTGLVWEQKDGLDGTPNILDPHDADNVHDWSRSAAVPDGTAFVAFISVLNGGTSPDGVSTDGCFTGHCDWRLPTIEELDGIADATQGGCGGGSGPCLDPIFGPTQADGYWSATTFTNNTGQAWLVDFSGADTVHGGKTFAFFVRAVRGWPAIDH